MVATKRGEILNDAANCVMADRDMEYGDPEDSFAMIADLWTTYLQERVVIRPRDVAAMMALLKIARISRSCKRDNWVDLAGYAACGGELDDQESETTT